jgi:endonuclease/exonuclease/phosphatase family metal-dependent hydrolase
VALTISLALQMARLLFPIVFASGERSGTAGAAVRAGVVSLLVFLAPLVAPLVRRLVGVGWSVRGMIAALAILRGLVQIVHPVPLWMAAGGTAVGLVAVTLLLISLRSEGSRGIHAFVLGTILGLALDAGLRIAFWTWDAVWQRSAAALIVTLLASVLLLTLVSTRAKRLRAAGEGGRGENGATALVGPFLFLHVLFIGSVAFVASAAGLSVPAAGAVVLFGDAMAVAVVTWVASRSITWPVRVAGGAVLIVAASLLRATDGALVVGVVLAANVLASSFLFMALVRGIGEPAGSIGRTSRAVAGGMFAFMLFLVLYQIHYRVHLPFPNTVIPPVAALLLALGGLGRRGWPPGFLRVRPAFLVAVPLLLLILPAGTALARPDDRVGSPGSEGVRLINYNVHLAIDADGQLDPEEIARVIEQSGPDVVALQEVPRGWAGAGTTDLAEWFSQRLRMPYRFAPAADDQFGNLILSRLPVIRARAVLLPRIDGAMDRSYLLVMVDVGGGRNLTLIDAHLEGNDRDHRAHTEQLLSEVREAPHTVIAGDMNMQPDDPDVLLFQRAGLVSAQDQAGRGAVSTATHPKKQPGGVDRVDWIFGTTDISFSSFAVGRSEAADHLPLTVVVSFS